MKEEGFDVGGITPLYLNLTRRTSGSEARASVLSLFCSQQHPGDAQIPFSRQHLNE